MKVTKIYTLSDPRTHEVRYVGKTFKALEVRHAEHVYKAVMRQGRTPRDCWIRELAAAGHRPVMQILETVTGNWREQEMYWINYYVKRGNDVVNVSGIKR